MRFTILEGNPTGVFDRTEGQVFHLQTAIDALTLCDLLNTMQSEIERLDPEMNQNSGLDFSGGKIHTVAPCINTACINYAQDYQTNCIVHHNIEECEDYVPKTEN